MLISSEMAIPTNKFIRHLHSPFGDRDALSNIIVHILFTSTSGSFEWDQWGTSTYEKGHGYVEGGVVILLHKNLSIDDVINKYTIRGGFSLFSSTPLSEDFSVISPGFGTSSTGDLIRPSVHAAHEGLHGYRVWSTVYGECWVPTPHGNTISCYQPPFPIVFHDWVIDGLRNPYCWARFKGPLGIMIPISSFQEYFEEGYIPYSSIPLYMNDDPSVRQHVQNRYGTITPDGGFSSDNPLALDAIVQQYRLTPRCRA